jgi:uncharacterized protein YaaR (DUF327 family)
MIEISKTGNKRDMRAKIKSRKKSSKIDNKTFASQLDQNISYDFEGTINELMNDLKEKEKHFYENQSLYELNIYKALVKKILKTVLDESFSTKTLKRKKRNFADFTIQEIDTRLLHITDAVTRGNRAFNLMKSIEEIRGLVFDLLH